MNESNCAGSYSNNSVGLNLNYASASPFSVQINMVIRQLIPATLEVNVCGGGGFNHTTALERIVEDIQVYDGEVLDPIPETVPSYKRNKTYNPSPLTPYGQSQLANLPKTCINFKVYYIGSLFSSVYSGVAKTYFLDSGAYEIKINIPISPPAIRGYRLNDGFNDYFTGVSDIDGIMNWTPIDMSAPAATFNMELHVYDGLTQVFNSDAQFVFLKYDLTTNACPCACPVNCGDITVIFNQSCGGDVALKLNLQIQQGNYSIEGDSFTQGDSIIRPITKTKATYELVISEYSDEVYLALMDLIGNNEYIEVVDNIDPLNPETVYYVDLERLDPNWNFNSKLGSMVIPVIKKDSIKTFRRNCCD